MATRKVDRTKNALPQSWRPGTATPAGWSFYSLWMQCPRAWFYKYYLGLCLPQSRVPNYLTFGTVYHALHQGITPVQILAVGEPYSVVLPEAQRLYERRLRAGLPPAIGHEVLYTVRKGPLAGIYTCQIDRLEKDGGRELKTHADLTDLDELRFKTNGEVIGELLASELPIITVDIITKSKAPQIRQIVVRRTDNALKMATLTEQIATAADEIVSFVRKMDGRGMNAPDYVFTEGDLSSREFPRKLGEGRCTPFGDCCAYFGPCWEGEEKLTQLKRDEETQRWRNLLL